MYEIPWSARSSRDLTESLATIWLTVKCFPTPRRNSNKDIDVNQSALLTKRAPPSPSRAPKSRNLASWPADAGQIGLELLLAQKDPLLGLAARIPDEPGTAPGHGDRPVTGQLQPAEGAHLEQMAHVEAVGGGVEPAYRR